MDNGGVTSLTGDCREVLKTLPDGSVHCCITSPPYYGLRSYDCPPSLWPAAVGAGHFIRPCRGEHHWKEPEPHGTRGKRGGSGPGAKYARTPQVAAAVGKARFANGGRFCELCHCWEGQLGLEPSLDLFVEHLCDCFDELQRVLRKDATLWVVIGDSYCSTGGHTAQGATSQRRGRGNVEMQNEARGMKPGFGIRTKELLGVPWLFAFAMRRRGWRIRQRIIWDKPTGMPESVKDRCTIATEEIFMFTVADRYFYDAEAIAEPVTSVNAAYSDWREREYEEGHHGRQTGGVRGTPKQAVGGTGTGTKNRRNVWRVNSANYAGSHYATFPPELVELMIKAGTSEKGVCSACGAPWRPVVVKGEADAAWQRRSGGGKGGEYQGAGRKDYAAAGVQNPSDLKRRILMGLKATERVEWQPGCRCEAEVAPATVLDPFGGTGTTALVARRLGRRAILIDIAASYVDLQDQRLDPVAAEARAGGQLSLLEAMEATRA